MDICTFVLPIVSTLLACAPQMHCEPANGKQYCQQVIEDCNRTTPYYECKRPDGSTYTAPLSEHPILFLNAN